MESYPTLERAVELIHAHTIVLAPQERHLDSLCGEVLAADERASHDQPPFPRSPLDGYAVRAADTRGACKEHPVSLTVTGRVYAGEDRPDRVVPGTAVRIMTGARIPDGADTVIRQEDTDLGTETVRLHQELYSGQNYCRQGEDFQEGTLLLKKGTVIDSAAAAILANNGSSTVSVIPKPRVAVLTTGDEVVAPGQPLLPGKIYDANGALLQTRLREWGMEAVCRHLPDDEATVRDALLTASRDYDAIFTTGGVSVGERDILNPVLNDADSLIFDGVALKPGAPTKFSIWKNTPVLSLSGNPFAAAAMLELLGRPVLAALSGNPDLECRPSHAVLQTGFSKPSPGRRFLRGTFRDGMVTLPEAQSSGQLFSLLGCNCLVDVPAGSGSLEPGQTAVIWML